MSCPTPQETITAYVDGELDAREAAELERHLGGCRDCTSAVAAQRALRAALGDADLRFRLPAEQAARLRRSLGEPRAAARPRPWRRLLLAAALAGVALAGFLLGRLSLHAGDPVSEGIVASHVRSLLGEHLVDVETSDRHTVKPWFNGRLDYAVPVLDLAADGFPLRGGRLDYFAGERAAALVYQSDRHTINLFVRPEPAASRDAAPSLRQVSAGFQIVHWRDAGMGFWAISDLEPARLEEFARRFRERQKAPGAG